METHSNNLDQRIDPYEVVFCICFSACTSQGRKMYRSSGLLRSVDNRVVSSLAFLLYSIHPLSGKLFPSATAIQENVYLLVFDFLWKARNYFCVLNQIPG